MLYQSMKVPPEVVKKIVKPGSRTIYQYKAKDEIPEFPARYGGFTSGK